MFTPADDLLIDHLADEINLVEPWRDIDAETCTFCPCSLILTGTCSAKNRPRARGRSRYSRHIERGKRRPAWSQTQHHHHRAAEGVPKNARAHLDEVIPLSRVQRRRMQKITHLTSEADRRYFERIALEGRR
jgi:hypothetical protein